MDCEETPEVEPSADFPGALYRHACQAARTANGIVGATYGVTIGAMPGALLDLYTYSAGLGERAALWVVLAGIAIGPLVGFRMGYRSQMIRPPSFIAAVPASLFLGLVFAVLLHFPELGWIGGALVLLALTICRNVIVEELRGETSL